MTLTIVFHAGIFLSALIATPIVSDATDALLCRSWSPWTVRKPQLSPMKVRGARS